MNNKVSKILMLTVGAAIGSAVTYVVVKKKYEQIAQEEIDSVKETYADLYKNTKEINDSLKEIVADVSKNDEEDEDDIFEKEDESSKVDYSNIISSEGYDACKEYYEERKEKNDMDKPYVISPEDFNQIGYETTYLTYYADGILEDDFGDVVETDDIDDLIGADNLDRIGEYEDDILHIRNDDMGIDFEISRDYRSFSEIK